MKNILFILLAAFGIAQTAKGDTTDFWHVYYNQTKIQEFGQGGYYEITLKRDSIKNGDTITVKYFRDTPCSICPTFLTVENDKHEIFVVSSGKGTLNPVSFSVNRMIELSKQGGKQTFEVFYSENEFNSLAGKILLFRIKLE